MDMVDLHVHSNRSDGTFSPTQLVDYAMEKGLSAFALTDHDTIDGLQEALDYAGTLAGQGMPVPEVIPGIEFSTQYQGKDVHIVGLYIDYRKPAFRSQLQDFVDSRIRRNEKMCGLLQGAGIDITYEKLLEEFPDAVITRAHYARYLLSHGYIRSMNEAFERYIGDRCPYFVPREKVTPEQAIRLILNADGIPILAHPVLYHLSDAHLDELTARLKGAGLMGIEALYSTYSTGEENKIRALADKYHLLLSGGSDFHGSNKPGLDMGNGYGRLEVPAKILTRIKSSRSNLLFTDMDGTLLNDSSQISPAMKEALDRMALLGHRLILTSGRPLPSILEVCSEMGLQYPGMIIISGNGGLIYDCDTGRPVLEQRLEMGDVRSIIEEADKMGLHIHGYTDSEIVCRCVNEEIRYYTRRIHMPVLVTEHIADALPRPPYKLQAIHLTDKKPLEAFRDRILTQFGDRVTPVFSNDQYLEILPAAVSKGNALQYVCSILPAMLSHTYAAGDAENDLSLLTAAHISIAMKNASDAVKQNACIVTSRDNNHDGLLEILDRYFS